MRQRVIAGGADDADDMDEEPGQEDILVRGWHMIPGRGLDLAMLSRVVEDQAAMLVVAVALFWVPIQQPASAGIPDERIRLTTIAFQVSELATSIPGQRRFWLQGIFFGDAPIPSIELEEGVVTTITFDEDTGEVVSAGLVRSILEFD